MAWSAITEADVLAQFTPDEQGTIESTQGAVDNLPAILALVIATIRDAIRSGGYAVDPVSTTTLPDGLHRHCIALARWDWLTAMPELEKLQTKPRAKAADSATALLGAIARQSYSIEPATAGANPSSGQWQSKAKLVMRTDPIPDPAQQFQLTDGNTGLANPSGPQDT